jgi:hypothetical protein
MSCTVGGCKSSCCVVSRAQTELVVGIHAAEDDGVIYGCRVPKSRGAEMSLSAWVTVTSPGTPALP